MGLSLFRLLFSYVSALERLLKDYAGRFATGDEVFLVWFPVSSVSVPVNLIIVYAASVLRILFFFFSIHIECTKYLT